MLDEKKKWFLLNSGGGAQASTPPSFLWANGWSETRVDAGLVKVGADSYDFQISDDAGFSNIVAETLASVSELTTFTGLTPETDYYVRCRAKFGSVYSDWLYTSCYTLSTPLHAYDFRGIGYDTTNEYGKTGSPNTGVEVGEVYSYRGSANTLTPTTGTKGGMQWQDTGQSRNRGSAYPRFAQNNVYSFASPVNFGTGDYTFLIEYETNNLSTVFVNFLTNSSDANSFITINNGSIRYRFITGTGGNYQTSFPSTLTSHSKKRIAGKRVGTSAYAGIVDDDGNVTWGSPITNANVGLSAVFDRLFGASSQSFFSIINFYNKELTDTQIAREFKRAEQPAYTFKDNSTHIPQGVTFTNALNGGYYDNDNLSHSATAGNSWVNVLTKDDYSIVRLATKESLLPDILKHYKHSNGYVGGDIVIGAPGSVVDGHNIGSLFLADNTILHLEMDIHYDKGLPTKIVIKKFGDSYNMVEYTTIPSGNGIPSQTGSQIQYLQGAKAGGLFHIMAQEYHSGTGNRWYTVYTFRDGFNYCEKTRIIDTEGVGGRWFYGGVIHSEDNTLRMKFDYIPDVTAGSKYAFSIYLEAPLTAGRINTVNNLMYGYNTGGTGAWSKNIVGNNSPATITELTTNCIMGLNGTAKTYSVKATTVFYDPTDGKVYACLLNGDNNGLIFCHSVAGEWVQIAIDLLSHNIVCGYSPSDSVGHGSNAPTIVRTGANTYKLLCQEVVSGSYPTQIWKGVEFSTTDTWATSSFVGDLTDSNHHDRMSVTNNMHFTGGSTAYNGKRLLVMSKEFTSPDNHSHTKFIDIS